MRPSVAGIVGRLHVPTVIITGSGYAHSVRLMLLFPTTATRLVVHHVWDHEVLGILFVRSEVLESLTGKLVEEHLLIHSWTVLVAAQGRRIAHSLLA